MKPTIIVGMALLTFALGSVAVACLPRSRPIRNEAAHEVSSAQGKETENTGCLDPHLPKPKVSIHFGVLNSKAIALPKPDYPPEAKANDISGEVKALVVVDEQGKIAWAELQGGHQLLQSAVKKVVCRARFKPIKVARRAVKVNGILTYKFVLPGVSSAQQSLAADGAIACFSNNLFPST